jgi:hypothetical protein
MQIFFSNCHKEYVWVSISLSLHHLHGRNTQGHFLRMYHCKTVLTVGKVPKIIQRSYTLSFRRSLQLASSPMCQEEYQNSSRCIPEQPLANWAWFWHRDVLPDWWWIVLSVW